MKRFFLFIVLISCLSVTWAQDKVLKIPYATGKSIYGIISEPSNESKFFCRKAAKRQTGRETCKG